MKPWNKRLGKSLSPKPLLGAMFGALEDASPGAANLLRFHSRTHLIQPSENFDTIYRPVRVLEDRYIRQYEIIRNAPEGSSFPDIEKAYVPIHTAFVENVVIHGHIKAPITRSGGDAIGYYFPFKRLDWGDVYPLPFFKNDYIAGDVIFIPRLTNIFHLLVEHVIPAVTAVIRYRSDIKKKLTIVSQIDFPILNFFVTFLRQLGIDADLRIVSPVEKISVERLIVSRGVPDKSGFSYAYAEELAVMSDFIDQAISKINVPEVCYIERSQTPRRNILNQDRLIEALSSEGATPAERIY